MYRFTVQALRICKARTAYLGSRDIDVLYRYCGSSNSVWPIGGVEVYLYCTGTEPLYRPYGLQGEWKYRCTVQALRLHTCPAVYKGSRGIALL